MYSFGLFTIWFGKFYTEHKPKRNRKNRHFAHGNKKKYHQSTKNTVCADFMIMYFGAGYLSGCNQDCIETTKMIFIKLGMM